MRSLLAALLLAALSAPIGRSQAPAEDGSNLEVYVMTMGQGDYVYERFGHNALGVRDRVAGTDVVFNWGTFSFGDPDFVPRFLTGTMRYWVQAEDALYTIAAYQQMNRSVWIQELNLTSQEKAAVRDYVRWNVREENRFYRYDFFGDNCSTRVRDVLNRVLQGRLREQLSAPTGRSYRDEVVRLTSEEFWTSTGIDLALGPSADHRMTEWEAGFIPMALRDGLRHVQRADGRPLVAGEREVFAAARAPESAPERTHLLRNMLIGLFLGAVVLLLFSKGGAWGVRAAGWVSGVTSAVCGLLGVVLVLVWAITEHRWMFANANIVLFNPGWLVVVVSCIRTRRAIPAWCSKVIAVLGVGASLALVSALGHWPQDAERVAALVLPAQFATLTILRARMRQGGATQG